MGADLDAEARVAPVGRLLDLEVAPSLAEAPKYGALIDWITN